MTKVSSFVRVLVAGSLILSPFTLAPVAQATPPPAADFGLAQAAAHRPVCDHASTASAEIFCHARVKVDPHGKPQTTSAPAGLSPQQIRSAYNLGSGRVSTNTTIAIVAAYDNPNIFNDLKTYSTQFGLQQLASCPVSAGTTSRPCFQKVDQNGGANYPVTNTAWAMEIAMDVQIAHAICENCNILLVEATSNSYTNLFAAIDRAILMGATVVSNSYGSAEFEGQANYDARLNHPGVAITFSSGDLGLGAQYPAASPFVTAVGGTTLNLDGANYISETAWAGSGSGCSAYSGKPTFQTDSACANRTIADVAAVADPSTGAAVFYSTGTKGKGGGGSWFVLGGTSLSSPIVAGVYALAGVPAGSTPNSFPYANTSGLRDVTSGSNGSCSNYLCTAGTGFDGPTGLGTPRGLSSF